MKIIDKLKQLRHWREMVRDLKLKRAGQRRIAPYGARGRTHVLDTDTPSGLPGNVIKAIAEGKCKITARHYHAATGEWEDLGELKAKGGKGHG